MLSLVRMKNRRQTTAEDTKELQGDRLKGEQGSERKGDTRTEREEIEGAKGAEGFHIPAPLYLYVQA